MKVRLFILTLLINPFFSYFLLKSQNIDTTFIKPSELEKGWGLHWSDPDYRDDYPQPKSYLWGLSVSPDGRYIAFKEFNALKALDMITNQIMIIDSFGYNPKWLSDSKRLLYNRGIPFVNTMIWNVKTRQFDSIINEIDGKRCFCIGSSLASDNYIYFSFPQGYPPPDSLVYKTNLDSSIKIGYPVNELMKGILWERYEDRADWPLFPPNSIKYEIHPKDIRSESRITGFNVVNNFNYKNRQSYYYPKPDTSWIFSSMNTIKMYNSGDIVLGPNGDVYAYLSFRSKTDSINHYDPPFDSAAIAARNAC